MQRSSADERGSALVLALVIVFFVGVITSASLAYANTSIRASNLTFKPERASTYDADGAIRAAMQYVRADQAAGGIIGQDLGLPCPTGNLEYSGSGPMVSVSICPEADSLVHSGGYRPVLLTLGTDASEGILLDHNGAVNVGGHVFSNSIISLGNPTRLNVTGGRVWAWGACTQPGNISITNPTSSPVCDAAATFGGVRPKIALDPDDASLGHAADWLPAASEPASFLQPAIPACAGDSATLNPGVYYDPSALSALTTSCANTTLAPGVYFLNFPSSGTPWNITRTVAAACDTGGQGAQLVLANQSKLTLSGTLRIPCSRSANSSAPRIALYGLKSPLGATAAATTVLRPTTAIDSNGAGYFTATASNALPSAAAGYPADGTNATAVMPKSKTGVLTLGGFTAASGSPIAGNAVVNSLVVKVAHDEQSGISFNPAPRLTWGTCAVNLTPTRSAAATTWTSGNLKTSFQACAASPTATMSLEWSVTTPKNPTSTWTAGLDGAQVEVNWTSVGMPALTGCMVAVGGCSIIDPGSNGGALEVNDVLYVPQGKFAGQFNLSGSFKLGTALIARTIDLEVNPNVCGNCTAIGDDPNPPRTGRVILRASIAGTDRIHAAVAYNGATLAPSIKSWIIKP